MRDSRLPAGIQDDLDFCTKYTIEDLVLGHGGSGVVVAARHRGLDERVAIKFLRTVGDGEAIARFRAEARAAYSVKSEHVVRIIDVSTTTNGTPYIVMEYLEGADLECMLLQTPKHQLPVHDAVDFILQACEGLAESHLRGIVHRDLKPSNLFCVERPDGLPFIKVLDFGISKLGGGGGGGGITGAHVILGSPPYMSPEQFVGSADVDETTDIWALGVILYQLVGGALPFADDDLLTLSLKVKGEAPTPLEKLRRDCPHGLPTVVMKCLAKARPDRYQTLAQVARALLPFGPARAARSVAQIVRVLESPGTTTRSLALPSGDHVAKRNTGLSLRDGHLVGVRKGTLAAALALAASAGATLALQLADPLAPALPRSHDSPTPPSRAADAQRTTFAELVARSPASSVPPSASTPPPGSPPVQRGHGGRVQPRIFSAKPEFLPHVEASATATPVAPPNPQLVTRAATSAAPSAPRLSTSTTRPPGFIIDIVEERKPQHRTIGNGP